MLDGKGITVAIVNDPANEASDFIISELWKYNERFAPVQIRPFIVMASIDDSPKGGVVARSWWNVLEIQYLWLHETLRGQGIGRHLMHAAEDEGRKHGCEFATVDTFSCQVPEFYQKLGYQEYGTLRGYAGKYARHYMSKAL